MCVSMKDWTLWQDEACVAAWLKQRPIGLPQAELQAEVILRLLRKERASLGAFLDVGCGDGRMAELALRAFPEARCVGVDGSEAMLSRGRERLAPWASQLDLRIANLEEDFWCSDLPGPFDAVLSGYAIHHVEDDRKRRIYEQLFDLLRPGGLFLHNEHVSSASPLGESLFEDVYVDHFCRQSSDPAIDPAAVRRSFRERPDRPANRLAPLETQLQWLREIGFTDVDCFWKYSELAIFAGWRR
jgi:tRNA (cmo5U34)-methyltransferase